MPRDVGSFPLTGVSGLPHIACAFPSSDHWSELKALETITPGEACIVHASGGVARASAGAVDPRMAVALRVIDIPDSNVGNAYHEALGPNQIRNLPINPGDYVHRYYKGVFQLTLLTPEPYSVGQLLEWDPAGARPTGVAGTGSWRSTSSVANAFFEVQDWRPLNDAGTEGIASVRCVRGT